MINFSAICPHHPVIIPSIGGSQSALAKKTISALEELAKEMKKFQPKTIVIISPHGPMRYDKFTINLEESLSGSFANFGAEDINLEFQGNPTLTKKILELLKKRYNPVEVIREKNLDYGSLVPLYYLTRGLEKRPKIIPLTFTALDWMTHYNFGKQIGEILENEEDNIAVIASGDLSHRLSETAPAGFSPYGVKFDHTIQELLKKGEIEKILNINPEFSNEAGECGLRSIIMALGTISGLKNKFSQISYEGPIGIGHLVGRWELK